MQPATQSISMEAVNEYQQIYKKEFGVEITREEAKQQGLKLLRLISIIHKPLKLK